MAFVQARLVPAILNGVTDQRAKGEAAEPHGEDRDLRKQVEGVLDPEGEFESSLEAMRALASDPAIRALLGSAANLGHLEQLAQESRHNIEVAVDSIAAFAGLGWYLEPFPVPVRRDAVLALQAGGVHEAEQFLLHAVQEWMLRRPVKQVAAIGAADEEFHVLFKQRHRLLEKALRHHLFGAYEASVPIVLAQIEGITADATGGKLFFSTDARRQADVVDDSVLAAIPGYLPRLRGFFSRGSRVTSADGGLSRHAVLHGRELAYDSSLNSAKCFLLLQAVLDWAMPRVRTEAARRRSEREAANAGVSGAREDGSRIDDREFPETRAVLRWLQTVQLGQWRSSGRFRSDVIGGWLTDADLIARGLPDPHGVQVHVREGEVVWMWRRTVSGWHLGIAMIAHDMSEYLWSAAEPPGGPPGDDVQWGRPFDTPADWRRG